MFDLEGKYVRVNNYEELDCLFEYANKHGWKWGNDGKELDASLFRGVKKISILNLFQK